MKYKIGDLVWYSKIKSKEKIVECPDCFGQKALTVIKGDGSQVSIDCCGCASGFENPKGYIKYWSWEKDVMQVCIERVEITLEGVKYGHSQNYCVKESDLFDTKEEAEIRAEELSKEHEKQELEKIYRKEKHNRTWSWNAHYHRRCIKQAEYDLAYHTAKLNVAKANAKEVKVKDSDEKL